MLLVGAVLVGCAQGASPQLAEVRPYTGENAARVSETLQVPLQVLGSTGQNLLFGFRGPPLDSLAQSTDIFGTASGGEFRWTPLPQHTGTHEFTFQLMGSGGGVIDTSTTVIEVLPGDEAAPRFLEPGSGDSSGEIYELGSEDQRCVDFPIEVRDADSLEVEIREREPLPDGAEVLREGPKRALFDWCPSQRQVDTSRRWTIKLEADDMEHDPVPHDHTMMLRTQ
jgi:hypothetical protein